MKCVQIPGYPDYQVSDEGDVFSVKYGKRRKLSPGRNTGDYETVNLWRDGVRRTFTVHKLVLTAFKGPRPTGLECRHKNGVPHDNRLENLEWGTRKDNQADRIKHGTDLRGERNPRGNAKLCPILIRAIRFGHECGRSNEWLAEMVDVHPKTIRRILSGKNWSNVT